MLSHNHHSEIQGISARAGEVEFFRLSLGKDKHAKDVKKTVTHMKNISSSTWLKADKGVAVKTKYQ